MTTNELVERVALERVHGPPNAPGRARSLLAW
jgi:hypothetical protein